jgi:hypothetical protein
VRDVVSEYSERSLNSVLPPIGDPDSVVRDVLDWVAGFGPLQKSVLDNPTFAYFAQRQRHADALAVDEVLAPAPAGSLHSGAALVPLSALA